MLITLLVASLLLTVLAPVVTRCVSDNELKVISKVPNYEKDNNVIYLRILWNSRIKHTDDTSKITVTIMNGGRAGGDVLCGNKEFTSSNTFTLIKDVTKFCVFITGESRAVGAE